MNILITGGCGYIGSCLSKMINDNFKSYQLFIIDDLSTGNKEIQDKIKSNFFIGKYSDSKILNKIFSKNKIDLVIHLAAKAIVKDSVKYPKSYINNNYKDSKKFIDFCIHNKVTNFLFSSTCNLYKFTEKKINEKNTIRLNSPYARSKYLLENYFHKLKKKNKNIKCIIFRFFNVSGSYNGIGEMHKVETHLIPNVIKALQYNKILKIYGNNYKTKDGTTIRDYIHVKDISLAFLKAIKIIKSKKSIKNLIINLGSNKGTSIKEIVDIIKRLYGINLKVKFEKKRDGDPAKLVASITKAKKILNWYPSNSNIVNIIRSNYKFYEKKY